MDPVRENPNDDKENISVALNVSGNLIQEWMKMINSVEEDKADKKRLYEEGKAKLEAAMSAKGQSI